MLARDYRPVADDDYLPDPSVCAMMGPRGDRQGAPVGAAGQGHALSYPHARRKGHPGIQRRRSSRKPKVLPGLLQGRPTMCPWRAGAERRHRGAPRSLAPEGLPGPSDRCVSRGGDADREMGGPRDELRDLTGRASSVRRATAGPREPPGAASAARAPAHCASNELDSADERRGRPSWPRPGAPCGHRQ